MPLVPHLYGPGNVNVHDSTELSIWLDERYLSCGGGRDEATTPRLLPADAALSFVARLVDDWVDEYFLYVLHHHRWIVSGSTTTAASDVVDEFMPTPLTWLPGLRAAFVGFFSRRQRRRLPYLFSSTYADADGNYATHALLEGSMIRLLEALERLLKKQRFLLAHARVTGARSAAQGAAGEPTCFSLADAAVAGNLLSCIRHDPDTADIIRRYPEVMRYCERIRAGEHLAKGGGDAGVKDHSTSDRFDSALLAPLMGEVAATLLPLLRANADAYVEQFARGERVFNERAWTQGRSMFVGTIKGQQYRCVVKTFQVKCYRDLQQRWRALGVKDREFVLAFLPTKVAANDFKTLLEATG